MTTALQPDYAAPPGWILEEMLAERDMTQAEFARRCARSAKLISEIIAGRAPVEAKTALEFEKVLGMQAIVWMNIEVEYQLHKERKKIAEKQIEHMGWVKQFPLSDMRKHGIITKKTNDTGIIDEILRWFNVASIEAWTIGQDKISVTCRHSVTFNSTKEALATWLRIGELNAEKQKCEEYNIANFKAALHEIRDLTNELPEVFLPKMEAICNDAGVAFTIVPSIKKTALSGASRWLSPSKAAIQLSAKYLVNDHFWFTFFHEAAHIILHSKKTIFIDEKGHSDSKFEVEANDWAVNFLVRKEKYGKLKKAMMITKGQVVSFARDEGIHPGIVVGMLQHDKIIRWDHMNGLKQKYEWAGD